MTRTGFFAACVLLPLAAAAQPKPATLLDDYARVTALVGYMAGYVGEFLLACTAAKVHSEAQAEQRYQAYQERNAAALGRADDWRRAAEERLTRQGAGADARGMSQQAGMAGLAHASQRVSAEVGASSDVPALCARRIAEMEAGRFDVSGNEELGRLLRKPVGKPAAR